MKDGQFALIAEKAGDNLREQILALEEDAVRAMAQLLEDSQETNKAPTLTISAQVKVAYTANPVTMTTSASVTVKHRVETSDEVEDPDQQKLGFDETKVTIKTGDLEVNTTAGAMKRAAGRIKK